MTWVRLDDNIFDNPKIVEVSPLARLLHLAGICYSAAQLTDGFVGRKVINRVHLQAGSNNRHVAELVAARLWHEQTGGWFINDYLEYNPSRETVLDGRAKKRAAGQAGGQASATARASRRGSRSSEPPSRPDPYPPKSPATYTPTEVADALPRAALPEHVREAKQHLSVVPTNGVAS